MRWIIMAVCVTVVSALCIYAGLYPPVLTLDDCLAQPAAHDGEVIYTPHESTIGDIVDGGFLLRWGGREIPVRGARPDLPSGTYIMVKGVFHKEGYIEALTIHVGRYRRLKMLVSIAGVAIVFYLLWKNFTWDRRERAFRERN
ncbi:MAG: hypothetical protein P8Z42_03670 [Anaerolineales bacterium]